VDVEPRNIVEHPFWWEARPRSYHVVFWQRPFIADDDLPSGVRQDQIMWSSSEWDVSDAADVHEVVAWADAEARRRGSISTLSALMTNDASEEGIVWLAGHDPSVAAEHNYARRLPPDVEPCGPA
jgi:hypothetical protein